jgi:hypothetical protein
LLRGFQIALRADSNQTVIKTIAIYYLGDASHATTSAWAKIVQTETFDSVPCMAQTEGKYNMASKL